MIKTPHHSKAISDYIGDKNRPFKITPLKGDASTRDYYRLEDTENPTRNSMVFMDLSSSPENTGSYFLNIQNLLKNNKIPVPDILEQAPDLKWFLLEDLGDCTLYRHILLKNRIPRNTYTELIKIMHRLHAIPQPEIVPKNSAFSRRFDTAKFLSELEFFKKHYLKGTLKAKISQDDEQSLTSEFTKLAAAIASYPQVLSHRDYHSKNIMIKGHSLYLIDFQDARLGPPQYDLASLLYDSYIELDEDFRQELKSSYIKKIKRDIPAFDEGEFNRIFYLTALQRNLKAIGTFAYQNNVRKNNYYLKFIKPTLAYIRGHFKKCTGLNMLERLLKKYIPLL